MHTVLIKSDRHMQWGLCNGYYTLFARCLSIKNWLRDVHVSRQHEKEGRSKNAKTVSG